MTVESPNEQDMSMDIRAMLSAVWTRIPRILLVTLFLLAATYGALMFVPKSYESGAALLVEPRDNVYMRAAGETPTSSAASDDIIISSQIELIKSRDTLMKVVESENLRDVAEFNGSSASPFSFITNLLGRKPSDKSIDEIVVGNLEQRLTVIRQRDSRIISVLVSSADPALAARLANAIANAHVQRRGDLSLSDTADATVWLEQEISKLRDSVAEAERKVADFRVANDLTATATTSSLVDQQLSAIAQQITSAQERQNTAMSRANLLNGLIEGGQAIEGVQDVRNSVVIQQLVEEKARLQGERAQKLATLLASHPTIKALAAQIEEIDNQIRQEALRTAKSLEAEAEIEGNLKAKLQADMALLKGSSSTATREMVTLNEMEREAKAQRDLLENYLSRYRDASSRTDSGSALPDVRVITEATPSLVPASPKTTLILIAVGIVSLVGQIGAILFGELLSGRAIVDRREGQGRDAVEPVLVTEPDVEPAPVVAQTVVIHEEMVLAAEPEPEEVVEQVYIDEPQVPPTPASVYDVAEEISRLAAEPLADEIEPLVTEQQFAAEKRDDEPDMFETAPDAPVAPVAPAAAYAAHDVLTTLSAEIGLGRVRTVMVAGLVSHEDCARAAETLVQDALHLGLSVVRIDAGSGRPTAEPGLADLSYEHASFGDVVHRSARDGLAEVPWGHNAMLNRRSERPVTLIEAVADIYEVVIVMTGRMGVPSTLPMFAGLNCPVVLVGPAEPDLLDQAQSDVAALGFSPVYVVEHPRRAAVA